MNSSSRQTRPSLVLPLPVMSQNTNVQFVSAFWSVAAVLSGHTQEGHLKEVRVALLVTFVDMSRTDRSLWLLQE